MIESLLKKLKWTSEKRKLKTEKTKKLNRVKPDENLLKSLKDRFNYASSTCSARILSTSPLTHSPSSLLASSKDSYLRFSCSKRSKFIVIELCQEVKVDAIVMANYELFSGTLKGFKVYGAADKLAENSQVIWKLLLAGELSEKGPFLHADQAFPVPSISDSFMKYLRIEFEDEELPHTEDLCPLSVLKVYGKTMLDEFTEELKVKAKGDNLPIYSDELVLSPELKNLIEEMTKLSAKILEEELNNSNSFFATEVFNPKCLAREQALQNLKNKYATLERKAFDIREQSKTSGNVFKHLHERLNKLEFSLKHPLNLILFRSRRHDHDPSNEIPQKLLASQDDKSVEDLFSSLNDDIFSLKQNIKRLQSDLSTQQTKITMLITFNIVLFGFILICLLKKFVFTKPANKSSTNIELRRRPLLELKSTSNLSISSINPSTFKSTISLQTSPKPAPNTPGVVLSDDEVLLLDESIRE
jgi:hypothetical protein